MSKPRVINICTDDFANYSYENAQSLKAVGVNAESFKTMKHVFGYTNESRITTKQRIMEEIHRADIVQLMHSDNTFLPFLVEKKKKFVVYHTGSRYRENSANFNSYFNPHVFRTLTDQCEFLSLGGKKIEYVATAINTEVFYPRPWSSLIPYTIGHFPSNPIVKGTHEIKDILRDVTVKFKEHFDVDKVKHEQQIKRMNSCDIYIELFKPTLHGKPYGCFGVTAFEAAALGKVVVTNNINKEAYRNAYGDCALFIANTRAEFLATVENLLLLNPKRMDELKKDSRDWIIKNHSYKANGERLKLLLDI